MPAPAPSRIGRILVVAVVVAGLATGLPIAATAFFGRTFLYLRTHLPPARLAAIASEPGWRLDRLQVEPGVVLVGLQRPPAQPDAPWIVFFGGNHSTLLMARDFLRDVDPPRRSGPTMRGWESTAAWGLAAYAYRGYDGSGGWPSESALESDAHAIVDHLRASAGLRPDRLVVVGYSLGTGVAAETAVHLAETGARPAGLVLLAPYTSMAAIFDEKVPLVPVGWVAPDTYRTDALAARIPGPVLVVHGLADRLVPPSHGIALASMLGPRASLVQLPGVEHDLIVRSAVADEVRVFVRRHTGG